MTIRIVPPFDGEHPTSMLYRLRNGDEITIVGEQNTKPGEYLDGTRLLCIRRNKRDKWWQFWKPRYKSSTFRYVETEEYSVYDGSPIT